MVPSSDRFKFVDDLTMLDIVNLVSIGISTYNFKYHIASDIGIDQNYISAEKLLSQKYLKEIEEWTDENKMKLNKEKSHIMIFNESVKYQFSTRLLPCLFSCSRACPGEVASTHHFQGLQYP